MAKSGEYSTLTPSFNGSLHIQAGPPSLTTNAGAVVFRDVARRIGLEDFVASEIVDDRDQARVQHSLKELLFARLEMMALGFRDGADTEPYRHDPAVRVASSDARGIAALTDDGGEVRALPSQPSMSRFTRRLAIKENYLALRKALSSVVIGFHRLRRAAIEKRLVIDVDSLPVDAEGQQKGSAHNGYYARRVFHPLIALIAATGMVLDVMLRHGTAHTAAGFVDFAKQLMDRVVGTLATEVLFRIDAGFTGDKNLAGLEKMGAHYVGRLANNKVLDKMAEPYRIRPRGRPPLEPRSWTHEMKYKAKSWKAERRVVLVVTEREADLFLRTFWLVTDLSVEEMPGDKLLELYRARGEAEARIGQLMSTLEPSLSSSTRFKMTYRGKTPRSVSPTFDAFRANASLLCLAALAANVMHAVRILGGGTARELGTLQRVRERVLRVAGRLRARSRQLILEVERPAFEIWQRIYATLAHT